jgi:hypothetical protein
VRKRQRSSFTFVDVTVTYLVFETGETRNFLLNGKDVLQEFCDPKDWQQLAQVRHVPLDMRLPSVFNLSPTSGCNSPYRVFRSD